MTALDVIAAIAIVGGALMSLIAGIAVLRFPDTATRIHAATKPQVLGIALLMIGLGIRLGTVAVIGELVLIVLLQLLTAPVAAHLAVRASTRDGTGTDGGPAAASRASTEEPEGP